jgi:hypothetical protein
MTGALGTVGGTGTPRNAKKREIAPGGMVTLERTTTAAGGGGLQPGLAIAWAQLHLDVLTAFEPMLTAAYARITDAGVGVESEP